MKRKEKNHKFLYLNSVKNYTNEKKMYAFLKCQNIKHFDILQLIYILSIAM